ncbi:NAA40 acetyltransferase, partial [Copsychus sechellarum]|nr:NAA40 acetyltransferase [Copsychus sechellarum]
QRKSSKAKEKKQRRLEERAAMAAVCAKVEAANKLQDPLEAFPVFKKYDRNGLNVSIECRRVSGLEPSTLDWAFELTKANMQSLWFGVKPEQFGPELGMFLGRNRRSFRVKPGQVWGETEAALVPKPDEFLPPNRAVRGPCSTQMKKVMLTVFKHNPGALQFFREALQFEVDPTSPSVSGCCGDDSSYEILSRSTRFGEPHPGGGPCAGCCH